jgi:hypothetical protein
MARPCSPPERSGVSSSVPETAVFLLCAALAGCGSGGSGRSGDPGGTGNVVRSENERPGEPTWREGVDASGPLAPQGGAAWAGDAATLGFPLGLVATPDGRVYAADAANGSVRELSGP